MASRVDDITITYEEEGIDIIKELDKKVLTSGAWATLIFKFKQWDRAKKLYGPERFSIRRYKKKDGMYIQQSKFNISSREQADKIVNVLQEWLACEDQVVGGSTDQTTDDSDA